jgi:hypothetical protein
MLANLSITTVLGYDSTPNCSSYSNLFWCGRPFFGVLNRGLFARHHKVIFDSKIARVCRAIARNLNVK